MGLAKGIVALVFFVFFLPIAFAAGFGISNDAAVNGYDVEIGIFFLVEFLLLFSTGLLIPGIFCILGKQYNKAKWYYALIPTTTLIFLFYTMIVAIFSPTSFVSNFIEFLGLGIGSSIFLAIIVVCGSFLKYY
ncbi:MAG: hypothetical protein ACTSPN_14760 [Promethearchaeota archaeon]